MKEINIELDKSSKVKLYHQLYQFFAGRIESSEIPSGTKLPSIRILSEKNGISRNTVTKAYSELEKNGYIYSLSKSGFFVRNPDEKIPAESDAIDDSMEVEDGEIPTVNSLLKNLSPSKASSHLHEEKSNLILTNMDADEEDYAKNETIILKDSLSQDEVAEPEVDFASIRTDSGKENSILMNSGDLVKSGNESEAILSPVDSFIDSCITALAEHHNRLESDKDADIQGEAPLRIAIASFIYKFHKIDINPAYIVVGPNLSYALFNLLQLDEFKNPSKERHGLLQLAENSIRHEKIESVAAISDDIDQCIIGALNASGYRTVIVNMDSTESTVSLLERINATIFISTTKNIRERKLKKEDRNLIFEWLNSREYRYFFEIDNIPEPHDYKVTENYSIRNRWIYFNSFAYLISKSINNSFMFLPKKILESYRKKFRDFGAPLSMVDQCGLIDFLIKGKLYSYLTNLEML